MAKKIYRKDIGYSGLLDMSFYEFAYTTSFFWGTDPMAKFHKQMCNFLDNDKHPCKRKLLQAFRGSRKSTLIQAYILWRIIRNPDIAITRACSTRLIADDFVKGLKNILEAVPGFRIFVSRNDWQSDHFTINIRSTYRTDPTVMSSSIGTNMVGRHPDLIIVDDPVDFDNSRTEGQRSKVKEWIESLESMVGPTGEIYIVGTTWHLDDVYQTLIDSNAYETLKISCYTSAGNATWPHRFSKSVLNKIKANMSPRTFAMQYMLDPAPEELSTFKALSYIDSLPAFKETAIFIDWGWGANGDYTAAIYCGVTADKRLVLVDAIITNQFEPGSLISDINNMANKYKADVYIDASALGPVSQSYPGAVSTWSSLSNRGSKESRISSIIDDYNRGAIAVYTLNSSKFNRLIKEAYDWDYNKQYDDVLDCVSYAHRLLVR